MRTYTEEYACAKCYGTKRYEAWFKQEGERWVKIPEAERVEVDCPYCNATGIERVEMVEHDTPGKVCLVCDGEGYLTANDDLDGYDASVDPRNGIYRSKGEVGARMPDCRGRKMKKCWGCNGHGLVWKDDESWKQV